MDRTIKFRAWSTENKKMYPIDEFTCNWNRNFVTKTSELVIKSTNILMQFTGLYDSEGKEIYEGDVVQATFQFKNNEPELFTSPVQFSVLWGATVEGEDVYSLGRCRNIKLIGNIYEKEIQD